MARLGERMGLNLWQLSPQYSGKGSGTSDRNSRTGNEEREIRAGSKISRPEREEAGNGKNINKVSICTLKLTF